MFTNKLYLTQFDDDFKHLMKMKDFLISKLQKYDEDRLEWTTDELRGGIFSKMSDGQTIRLVLPKNKEKTLTLLAPMRAEYFGHENRTKDHNKQSEKEITGVESCEYPEQGTQLTALDTESENECNISVIGTHTRDVKKRENESKMTESGSDVSDVNKDMTFVGFIGYSRPKELYNDELKKDLWEADFRFIDEFPNQKHLMAYVTAEREIGGDWSNLVICDSPEGVKDWQSFSFHAKIIKDISSACYTHIRIHRGRLLQGLSSTLFSVKQTIFLNYGETKENMHDTIRNCHIWKEGELTDYFQTGGCDQPELY